MLKFTLSNKLQTRRNELFIFDNLKNPIDIYSIWIFSSLMKKATYIKALSLRHSTAPCWLENYKREVFILVTMEKVK